jgi:hypothetical protein
MYWSWFLISFFEVRGTRDQVVMYISLDADGTWVRLVDHSIFFYR